MASALWDQPVSWLWMKSRVLGHLFPVSLPVQTGGSVAVSAGAVPTRQTQRPRILSPEQMAAIAMEDGARYNMEWAPAQMSNPIQPRVKRIPIGVMIPTTAMRLKKEMEALSGRRNRPSISASTAKSMAVAMTTNWIGSDMIFSGSIHPAHKKIRLIGMVTASRSVVVMLTRVKDSDSPRRKKGSKMTQPITPEIAKYGTAKISNIFNPIWKLVFVREFRKMLAVAAPAFVPFARLARGAGLFNVRPLVPVGHASRNPRECNVTQDVSSQDL